VFDWCLPDKILDDKILQLTKSACLDIKELGQETLVNFIYQAGEYPKYAEPFLKKPIIVGFSHKG